MNKFFVLIALSLPFLTLSAQTPFDAFSPETSRIILDGDSIADLRNEQLLLVDIATHRPVAAAPFTDEIKNWLSVDPLTHMYPGSTPYIYCGGNPIRFVDHNGMYYSEETEIQVSEFDKQLESMANQYTQQRDSYEAGSESYQKYDDLLTEINKSRQDLVDMRNDENYEYRFIASSDNYTSCTSYNAKKSPVVVMRYADDMWSHEGRHGGQNARREIIFRPNGGCLLYGVSSEVDAYRAQFAYTGSITLSCFHPELKIPWPKTISSLSEVTREFVSSIAYGVSYMYPPRFQDPFLWYTH